MKLFRWFIILLTLLPATPTSSKERSVATITLTSLEIEGSEGLGSKKIIGKFSLQNRSQSSICIMRDIIENELSPFMQILRTGKRRSSARSTGLPFPPKTRDIMKLAPGASVRIVRVLGYTNEFHNSKRAGFTRVRTIATWCGSNRRFRIETKRFKVLEPQNSQLGASHPCRHRLLHLQS